MLTNEDRTMVKANFANWLDIQDNKKTVAQEEKDLKEDTAKIMNTKPGKIGKLFKVLKNRMEKGVDEVDELQTLMVDLEG